MAIDGDERSELEELEARVYSRAGADEPRNERFDPVSGRSVSVTESEWRLLQARRARVHRGGATAGEAEDGVRADGARAGAAPRGGVAGETATGVVAAPQVSPRTRGRRPGTRSALAAVAGMVAGGALVAGWLVLGDAAPREPTVEALIAPTPSPGLLGADQVPGGDVFDVFRDGGLRGGTLPAGLDEFFPAERVARILRQAGPIRGADVYAAVSYDGLACLIVRLDPNGIVANCTSVERVRSGGLTLRAAIPSGIGSGRDPDGDGVAGDASVTDVLEVEWRADGTFHVVREPG